MIVYIVTAAILLLLALLCGNVKFKKNQHAFLFLMGAVLFFVAAFRYNVGTDYETYTKLYQSYKTTPFSLNHLGLQLVARIAGFLYDDYATWFFLMSAVTVPLVVIAIGKYSNTPSFAVLMYLFTGCWHESFNIVKQCAAIAILFLGYKFLRDRIFVKWVLVCLAAAAIHITAVVMIPVYFIARRKITAVNICLMVFIGIVIFLGYDLLFELAAWLKDGQSVTDSESDVGARTVNMIRVLVAWAPPLFFFLFKNKYDPEDGELAVLFNLSFLNAVLMLAASQSVYLTRVCSYTNVFNVLFLPAAVAPLAKQQKRLIIPVILALYAIFWYVDLSKSTDTAIFQWIFNRI